MVTGHRDGRLARVQVAVSVVHGPTLPQERQLGRLAATPRRKLRPHQRCRLGCARGPHPTCRTHASVTRAPAQAQRVRVAGVAQGHQAVVACDDAAVKRRCRPLSTMRTDAPRDALPSAATATRTAWGMALARVGGIPCTPVDRSPTPGDRTIACCLATVTRHQRSEGAAERDNGDEQRVRHGPQACGWRPPRVCRQFAPEPRDGADFASFVPNGRRTASKTTRGHVALRKQHVKRNG
jgi:hypothetical protein